MSRKRKLSFDAQKEVIKELLVYIGPYKKYLIVSVFSAFISVVATLVFPYLVGIAIDMIEDRAWYSFFAYLMIMILVALGSAVFQFVMNQANNKLTYYISRRIRKVAFDHIQTLPLSYLDSHSQGDIVSRIITDVEQISDGLLMGFTQLFTGVLTILGTLGILFYVSYPVAIVVLVVTPISLFTSAFIAKKTYHLFHEQSKIRGEETAYADEMILGEGVIEAFNMEKRVEKGFNEINSRLASVSLMAVFFSSLTNPLTRFVNALVYMGVALSGGLIALTGRLSVGALSAILTYASQYTKPFNEITGVVTELQNALSSAERVFSLISELSEMPDGKDALSFQAKGYVSGDDIYFSYTKDENLIEGFSFSTEPGMKVAIVGPTGCGKTTIINLLMRFYDVDSGSIKVDGVDIRDMKRSSLRGNYGMVLQETWLKNTTVRDNITYAKPDATEEEIERVIRLCNLEGFISSLPNGLNERISDEKENISQGQRQLLCIARVMLASPNMLILDEATSSIDTRTEILIQRAFSILMEGRTSFIVAHRLSTVKKSDLILVMKDGNIIEKGSHGELLSLGGFYNELYNSQFAK